MARPEFHNEETRNRLFRNTLLDPNDGVRDHAILRLLYGSTLRPIEFIRIMTHDLVDDTGRIITNGEGVVRKEISFNGRERPLPILDIVLIDALQQWVDYRVLNKIGVTATGFIDLTVPFFLQDEIKGFSTKTTFNNGSPKHSTESINRVIRKRYSANQVTGSVDSGLRTWTLERHREGRAIRLIHILRGDNDIASVQRIVAKDPVRLGALVEKVF